MTTPARQNKSAATFDMAALRLRQARAKRRFIDKSDKSADFLLHNIAEEIATRLALVSRDFNHAVDLFGRTGAIASTIGKINNVNSVSRVEIPEFYAECPGIVLSKSNPDVLDLGKNPVDLVVSGLTLQWSNDLPGTLIQLKNIMQPDGLFLGVLPGPDTLCELRECLAIAESEIFGGITPRIDPFVTIQTAGTLLQRAGFALPVLDSEKITIRYNSIYGLIHDLRAMAATNVLKAREKQKFSKFLFSRAAEIYASKFADDDGKIRVTFELIYLSGWVPHSSQQKPSKPGSVSIKLTDAIKHSKNQ